MYDIRQFKPTLYIVVLMGITGFTMAVAAPALWLIALLAIVFNAWLITTNRFAPLPRVVANIATVLAFLWAFMSVRSGTMAIIAIGNFLVILQLVKLYEQRANRDYAQLLVLSLLLMVAASIHTASLLFGILLIIYLFTSLYCCLLFHLKVEADNARSMLFGNGQKANPQTLRQDHRFLSRSMRRLTGVVSSAAITSAVAVFLFFPRGTGAGMFGHVQLPQAQAMTGFGDQVSYNQVARITQNNDPVAYVWVSKNDQPVWGGTLLLRGVALDIYTGGAGGAAAWQWVRSPEPETRYGNVSEQSPATLSPRQGEDRYQQRWSIIRGTGSNVLFSLGGPMMAITRRDTPLRYAPGSQTLMTEMPLTRPMEYTVIASGVVSEPAPPVAQPESAGMVETGRSGRRSRRLREFFGSQGQLPAEMLRSQIDPRIEAFARRQEVTGVNDTGPLADQRPADARTHALDSQIASNIESYLRREFAYTLDLTDTRRIAGEDPLVGFLTDYQRGHCEYFAGAMALMCQSLGMQARVVIGFKTDEFNEFDDRFMVRQSHAHAWVEVLTPEGIWQTFDPTSGNDPRFQQGTSWWKRMRHFFDFLELKWADNVVAYDADSRANLLTNVDQQLTNTAIQGNSVLGRMKAWLDEKLFWRVSSGLLGLLLWSMGGGVLIAIGWFTWERWKLRRRANRIGLGALPGPDKLRLVRQLGFYDDLMRTLERHEIYRPAHLTPREFAESLSWLPTEAYEGICRLTNVFYRIRYGTAQLQPSQRRRLHDVTERIARSIAGETSVLRDRVDVI